MATEALSLPHLVRPPKIELLKPPMLILLHGQGSDEYTLFELAPSFDERFVVVCPRAPHSILSRSYNWLATDQIRSDGESPRTDQSCKLLIRFIQEAVKTYRVDPTQVYLLGFGQGATMALSVMVAEPEILAGVIAISGQVPTEVHSIPVPNERFKDFSVMVSHGVNDETNPIAYGRAARDILSALRTDLTYREYTNGHTLSKEAISEARLWLGMRLRQRGVGFAPRQEAAPTPYQVRLSHITLQVRNLDRAIAFYTRFFGFRLVERTGNAYAFLGSQANSHHELALENVGSNAPWQPRAGIGHIAFELPDQISFARAYKLLTDSGIKVTTTNHSICWSIYFTDPDRNDLEFFWDTRHLPGHSHLWQGRDLPLDPAQIIAILSPDKPSP